MKDLPLVGKHASCPETVSLVQLSSREAGIIALDARNIAKGCGEADCNECISGTRDWEVLCR